MSIVVAQAMSMCIRVAEVETRKIFAFTKVKLYLP